MLPVIMKRQRTTPTAHTLICCKRGITQAKLQRPMCFMGRKKGW